MGTHCDIYYETAQGGFIGTYCHYDGYPDHMLPVLSTKTYNEVAAVILVAMGKGGLRSIDGVSADYIGDSVPELLGDPNEDNFSEYVYIKRKCGEVDYRRSGCVDWIRVKNNSAAVV